MKPKVIIWGASGHALVVADIIKLNGEYELAGFLDDSALPEERKMFCGLPIFGGASELPDLYSMGIKNLTFGFGNCQARHELANSVRQHGFNLVTAIHPAATVAKDVMIGEGTVVAAGAVINPCCRIGSNVIINTNASLDHESIIGDCAHICPGVALAGKVSIGEAAWVGIGSTVIEKIKIGAGAFIGAGSVVVSDIPSHVTAYGVPAKISKRKQ